MLVFLAIISKSVNNQCYNPYIFGKSFSRSFQKCMGCSIGLFTVFEINAKNTNTEGSTLIVATKIRLATKKYLLKSGNFVNFCDTYSLVTGIENFQFSKLDTKRYQIR